jgi:hypothetical protein
MSEHQSNIYFQISKIGHFDIVMVTLSKLSNIIINIYIGCMGGSFNLKLFHNVTILVYLFIIEIMVKVKFLRPLMFKTCVALSGYCFIKMECL